MVQKIKQAVAKKLSRILKWYTEEKIHPNAMLFRDLALDETDLRDLGGLMANWVAERFKKEVEIVLPGEGSIDISVGGACEKICAAISAEKGRPKGEHLRRPVNF